MTFRLAAHDVHVVLLDIEGTTTPAGFVHDVLFPYARAHLAEWLRLHAGSPELVDVARELGREHAAASARDETAPSPGDARAHDQEAIAAYVGWLMDRDRKSTALKTLQGLIWEDGYARGELRGIVYPDVSPALRRWREAGVQCAIYSSGSELAQRRLFASLPEGDITPLLVGFFDTAVGHKREPDSYLRIASSLGHAPSRVLFVSDRRAELDAASRAGYHTILCLRPDAPSPEPAGPHPVVRTFDEIL